MKRTLKMAGLAAMAAVIFTGCAKQDTVKVNADGLSATEVQMIRSAGLKPDGAKKLAEGYLIEGDLLLTAQELDQLKTGNGPELIVANSEQYRTTRLVTGLPRTLRVLYTGSNSAVSSALLGACSRYNFTLPATYLLKFQRVSAAPYNIVVKDAPAGVTYIASAGFPTSAGQPYNQILFNNQYVNWDPSTLVTVIAHELGHCIGFRHTDYMNRAYSCGGTATNEGTAGVGAILIPGTPTGADPNSWMLACIGNGTNRVFNANDIKALDYLY
jgi:hypothetical protein